jgi:hypothetical protein
MDKASSKRQNYKETEQNSLRFALGMSTDELSQKGLFASSLFVDVGGICE